MYCTDGGTSLEYFGSTLVLIILHVQLYNTNKTGSVTLKEWTPPDFRNMPSTTNLEREEIVDAPGKMATR
jgi:hypothetical protein